MSGTVQTPPIESTGCGLAPDALTFGVLRLLVGLALGGLLPSLNALTGDLVSARWRSVMATGAGMLIMIQDAAPTALIYILLVFAAVGRVGAVLAPQVGGCWWSLLG